MCWLSLLPLALALVSPVGTRADSFQPSPSIDLQDEGASQGAVKTLNCVGSSIACTKSGVTGTLTLSGGGGGYATIEDEGTPQTQRTTVNFTGAGVSCTESGGKTVCTIAGGGAGASWTTYELDFGSSATMAAKATVTDATVSGTSKIMVVQAGEAATGRQADENELDALVCSAIPAAGTFTLHCAVQRSLTHGKFKVYYSVG